MPPDYLRNVAGNEEAPLLHSEGIEEREINEQLEECKPKNRYFSTAAWTILVLVIALLLVTGWRDGRNEINVTIYAVSLHIE